MEPRQGIDTKQGVREYSFKALKITLKVAAVAVIYVFVMQFLAPASAFIPSLGEMATTFVIMYVVLMIVSDLTAGTVLQHFFNGARALFVIAYLIVSLNSGILNVTAAGISVIVDVRVFVVIIMLLGLLGLARSVMQAINFASERAELTNM